MKDNNKDKTLNVPHLRFSEFSGEWEICKVSDILDFYSTNSLAWEQLEYGVDGLKNLHYGLIHNGLSTCVDTKNAILPVIKQNCTPKNYTECQNGDVAFADASEDTNDVAKCVEFTDCHADKVVCGLHTIHGRDKGDKTVVGFKGYAFSSQAFRQQIRRLAQGTKIYSIGSKNFSECNIGIPSKEEQTKIATLLKLIDQRIMSQRKIIEDLKKLKYAISKRVFAELGQNHPVVNLGLLCRIKTGKLDANAMTDNGKFLFFTCAREDYRTDTYAFEGDSLLISGNGDIGIIKRYNGQFNAYQRTYVLQDFTQDIAYVQYFIEHHLPKRVLKEKNVGAMPYIVLSTLAEMPIILPSMSIQNIISKTIGAISELINNEENILVNFEHQKQYHLSMMFI